MYAHYSTETCSWKLFHSRGMNCLCWSHKAEEWVKSTCKSYPMRYNCNAWSRLQKWVGAVKASQMITFDILYAILNWGNELILQSPSHLEESNSCQVCLCVHFYTDHQCCTALSMYKRPEQHGYGIAGLCPWSTSPKSGNNGLVTHYGAIISCIQLATSYKSHTLQDSDTLRLCNSVQCLRV